MADNSTSSLSLDRQVKYQIKVPGALDPAWKDWGGPVEILTERNAEGQPVSTLTGSFDQAALLGFLRRLYSFGVPLISVICIDLTVDVRDRP